MIKHVNKPLKKILEICKRHQFFQIEEVDAKTRIQYGPLGSLLKRNIYTQWLNSLLNNSDVYIYPMEVQTDDKKDGKTEKNLASDILNNHLETIKYCQCETSFGFAVHEIFKGNRLNITDSIIGNFKTTGNGISVLFFGSTNKPLHWFHYWSKQRYLWWRKFSNIPSKFSMSEVVTTKHGNQQLSLVHEFPWGKEHSETITLYSDAYIKDLCRELPEEEMLCFGSKNIIQSVVQCDTNIDTVLFTYLVNSFSEKLRGGKMREIFQLHYNLAPYKICFLIEESNQDLIKKLSDVASHFNKEFKDFGIKVFPTRICSANGSASEFERFDEMGIPYVISLTEDSMLSGIAHLRNRDTTLLEQVHMSELTSLVSRYLKKRVR